MQPFVLDRYDAMAINLELVQLVIVFLSAVVLTRDEDNLEARGLYYVEVWVWVLIGISLLSILAQVHN